MAIRRNKSLSSKFNESLVTDKNIQEVMEEEGVGVVPETVYQKTEINSMFNNKQEKLISGYNIKTFNGQSFLGGGNIEIEEPDLDQYKSTVPVISTSAVDPIERSEIIVSIDDYSEEYDYAVNISGGTFNRVNGSITWELPFVPNIPMNHTCLVSMSKPGKLLSDPAEITVEVQDEVYGGKTISISDFTSSSLTNATLDGNDVISSTSGAIVELETITQDEAYGNYTKVYESSVYMYKNDIGVSKNTDEIKFMTDIVSTTDTVKLITETGTESVTHELSLFDGTVAQGDAFDISELYLSKKYNINDFGSLPTTNGAGNPYTLYDPQFSNNGLVAWYMHEDTSTTPDFSAWLYRIVLTSAYDVSTAVSVTVSPELINLIDGWRQVPGRFLVKNDGSKIWLDRSAILNVPGVDASAITFSGNQTLYMGDGSTTIAGNGAWEQIKWADSGNKIIIRDKDFYNIFGIYPLTTAYDPTTISTKLNEIDTSSFFSHNTGAIDISPDGMKLFLSAHCHDDTNSWHREVKSYSLSTAWDLSTATELVTQVIPGSFGAEFMYVSADGRTLHMTDAHASGVSGIYSISPELLTIDTTSVTAGATPLAAWKYEADDELYIDWGEGWTQITHTQSYCAGYYSSIGRITYYYKSIGNKTAPAESRTIDTKVIMGNANEELYYVSLKNQYLAWAEGIISTPSIENITDGDTGLALTPLLVASTYSNTDNDDTHLTSDYQIATDIGFINIVYEEFASSDLESHIVTTALDLNTLYYVRVRYNSSNGISSEFSTPISFTTKVTVEDILYIETIASESFSGICIDANDNIYACGNQSPYAFIVKIDSDGNKAAEVYLSDNTTYPNFRDIIIDAAGNIVVTYQGENASDDEGGLMKFDSDLNIITKQKHNAFNRIYVKNVIELSNNTYAWVGQDTAGGKNALYYNISNNLSTINKQVARTDVTDLTMDIMNSNIFDGTSLINIGYMHDSMDGVPSYGTIYKYNSTGLTQTLQKKFGDGTNEYRFTDIAEKSGTYFMAGEFSDNGEYVSGNAGTYGALYISNTDVISIDTHVYKQNNSDLDTIKFNRIIEKGANLVLIGLINLSGTLRGIVIEVDTTGDIINYAVIGEDNEDTKFNNAVIDSNGDILVAGLTLTNTQESNALIVKIKGDFSATDSLIGYGNLEIGINNLSITKNTITQTPTISDAGNSEDVLAETSATSQFVVETNTNILNKVQY
ncbi:MAG: hypothetical protein U9R03_04470 [Candidatus Aerophobetes bacterium]|nr:hypothetical protein [Candidatus Aerophobetes bacterium]